MVSEESLDEGKWSEGIHRRWCIHTSQRPLSYTSFWSLDFTASFLDIACLGGAECAIIQACRHGCPDSRNVCKLIPRQPRVPQSTEPAGLWSEHKNVACCICTHLSASLDTGEVSYSRIVQRAMVYADHQVGAESDASGKSRLLRAQRWRSPCSIA